MDGLVNWLTGLSAGIANFPLDYSVIQLFRSYIGPGKAMIHVLILFRSLFVTASQLVN